MIDDNQTPFALGATKLTKPHHCSAGAGWKWLSQGYAIFKQMPGLWILILLMTIVLNGICRVVPVVGDIASILISPVLLGGVMMVAHRCFMESDAQFDDLFAGFRHRLWPLVQVALFYLAGMVIMLILAILMSAALVGIETIKLMGDMINQKPEMLEPAFLMNIMIVVTIVLVVMLPVIMMYYFAPVLVMFHEVDAFSAMKLSFIACCKNGIPFLVYGLLVMLLAMLSVFTLFLGLLVLVPVIWASTYTAYRDIFLSEEEELAA